MIEYFKKAFAFLKYSIYELQNRQISSASGPGHMTQFWCK